MAMVTSVYMSGVHRTSSLLSWKVTLTPREGVVSTRLNTTGTVTQVLVGVRQSRGSSAETLLSLYRSQVPPGPSSHGQYMTSPTASLPADGFPGGSFGPSMSPHQLHDASKAPAVAPAPTRSPYSVLPLMVLLLIVPADT